jgi:hypothetical protein
MEDLISDVYDYLFENDFGNRTNFCDEFPASAMDEEEGVIYLARTSGDFIYKITIERV